MNLNNIVAQAVSAVNPFVTATYQQSSGSTTGSDGSRTPAYLPAVSIQAQVQALQYNDIAMTEGLNLQGVRRKIYVNGHVEGLVRSKNRGGDIITFPNGEVWLVVMVAEHWPNWTSFIVTLQDNS